MKQATFFCMTYLLCIAFASHTDNFRIIVLSQPNTYHVSRAVQFRENVRDQANSLNISAPSVLLLHEEWTHVGAWTLLPIIPSLAEEADLKTDAFVFCNEDVHIELHKFLFDLMSFDFSQELFIGRPLHDHEATIIHHFAFHENPSGFVYPDFSSCFVLSFPLIKSLSNRLKSSQPAMDFTIDVSHELALFIWNKGSGIKLTEATFLCGYVADVKDSSCSAWLPSQFPQCGEPVADDEIFVAVKTCEKFHTERVNVVKMSWATDAKHIVYFSDVDDALVPTVTLGIPNTERGHCAKLLAILEYVNKKLDKQQHRWIVVVDDDSLLSVKRLKRLLACYDSTEPVALGERYGYGLQRANGYNYITLGGGMVLSDTALRWLVTSDVCHCATPDAPDDMTMGLCLKHLGLQITHSPYFHQARPMDYSSSFLHNQLAVSFHRHWMLDPIKVYRDWLTDDGQSDGTQHQEL